jgi:hypothetical protein
MSACTQSALRCSFLLALAVFSAGGFAQTFKSTEGNTYTGRHVGGGRENHCVTEVVVERSLRVGRDDAAGRLTFTMDIEKTRDAVYRGVNAAVRAECDPGKERSTATVRFYITEEGRTATGYSGTVIQASKSVHGFKTGDRIAGSVEVYDGGRGLDFSNEEFSEGVARVLASSFRNAAGNEQAYFVPARTPDLVLQCKVIAADGTGTQSSTSRSEQVTDSTGRVVQLQGSQQGSTSSSACLAHGWQNLRKTVSVWLAEQRCDGQRCEVAPTHFRWPGGYLSRSTGQMKDSCYTFECDKAPTQQLRF